MENVQLLLTGTVVYVESISTKLIYQYKLKGPTSYTNPGGFRGGLKNTSPEFKNNKVIIPNLVNS